MTASDWIERVRIAIDVCGYAHVPHEAIKDFNVYDQEIKKLVLDCGLEVMSAQMGVNFQKKHIEPEVVFGGEKPKKQKKVIAKYVWSSML